MPAPTRLFDISNGNGATVNGETVDRGTLIWYRDNAAKNDVVDSVCLAYGYQATVTNPNFGRPGEPETIPNPQSKQAFFNRQVTQWLRETIRSVKLRTAEATARETADAAILADLP